MRLLFLSPHYPPDPAATGQLLEELSEDLVADGHEVVVVAARPSYIRVELAQRWHGLYAKEVRAGVEIRWIDLPALGRRGIWSRLIPFAAYTTGAAALLPTLGRFDAVYALSTPPILGGLLAAAYGAVRRTPFVYNLQDVYPEVAQALGVIGEGAASRVVAAVERRLRRRADAVTLLAEDMRERIRAADDGLDNLHIIPNWSDPAIVHPVPKAQNPFVAAHGLEGRFVVLYSGNLGRAHGAEALPEIAQRIADLEDTLLLIVGEGPMKAEVQQEVERRGLSNVRFLPYQPKSDLAYSLSAADVSLILQKEETRGLVVPSKLYGILASGRAAVAAVPAASEVARVLAKEEAGLVVSPGDAAAMAQAIRELHADQTRCAEMGRRARQAAETTYSRRQCTRAYAQLFESLGEKAA